MALKGNTEYPLLFGEGQGWWPSRSRTIAVEVAIAMAVASAPEKNLFPLNARCRGAYSSKRWDNNHRRAEVIVVHIIRP